MFKKEIYSLLLFSFGLLFTCCGESATDDEEKDNNGQGSVSVETNYLPIADPYVMFYNNKYYAYGTGGTTAGEGFACFSSSAKQVLLIYTPGLYLISPSTRENLLKNSSQIRKLISVMVAYPMEVSFTTPFFALSSSNKKLPSFCVTVPAINAESVQVRSTTLTNSIGSLFSSTTLPVMFCAKEV